MVGLTRSELIERLIERTRSKQPFHAGGRKDNDMLLQVFDVKDCDLCVRAILGYMVSSLVAGTASEQTLENSSKKYGNVFSTHSGF